MHLKRRVKHPIKANVGSTKENQICEYLKLKHFKHSPIESIHNEWYQSHQGQHSTQSRTI